MPSLLTLENLLECASARSDGLASILDELIDRAVEAESGIPPRFVPRLHLAQALLDADRPLESLEHLKICGAQWPSSAKVAALSTRAAIRCGRFDEAKQHLGTHRALNQRESHLHLEAAFSLRFNLKVDWVALGRDLLRWPGSRSAGPLLALQVAARRNDETLAASALAELYRSRVNFSIPERQAKRIRKMVRKRLLQLLLAR